MKASRIAVAFGMVFFLLGHLRAQVPLILNHQGRVTVGGVPFQGAGQFKFALVNGDGSQRYWLSGVDVSPVDGQPDTAVSLAVSKGLYSVGLGDTAVMLGLDASMLAHPDVRLRVWFNDGVHGSQLLVPDERLRSAPYAVVAATVSDGAITAGKIAPGAVGSAQLASGLTLGGTTTGNFSGSGAGLTGIPASAVVTAPPGMVLIPGGAFTMGRTSGDTDPDAVPVSVTVAAFYMDVNEVSLSLWQSVHTWATLVGGYRFSSAGAGKGANHPVQNVSWYDCVKWCNARSEQAGKPVVYFTNSGLTSVYRSGDVTETVYLNSAAKGYRLPTEAEWEKAARGGVSGQRFPWGDQINQKLANYYGATASYVYDSGPNGYNAIGIVGGVSTYTTPVGTFAANGYGLYDMAGNVWEWCWDWYDPRAPALGRVGRGGGWSETADRLRSCFRRGRTPSGVGSAIGFRCAL